MNTNTHDANKLADFLLRKGAVSFLFAVITFSLNSGPLWLGLLSMMSFYYTPIALFVGVAIKIWCSARP
jgi:hypothetical protein